MQNDEKKLNPFKLKLAKIGDSDYRFDVWYKVSDKSKIPFGYHVEEEEIEKCENILFAFDLCKNMYFREYEIEILFFIDSREYGCGGHVSSISKISFAEDLQKKFKELSQKAVEKIETWGLEINKDKLIEQIQDLKNQKKDIDCSIGTLKQMLEESLDFQKDSTDFNENVPDRTLFLEKVAGRKYAEETIKTEDDIILNDTKLKVIAASQGVDVESFLKGYKEFVIDWLEVER